MAQSAQQGTEKTALIVTGSGRSGTTLLVELLSLHSHLAWFSQYNGRWPKFSAVSLLSRIEDIDAIRHRTLNNSYFPMASETIRVWDECFPGFHTNHEDFGPEQVTPERAARFRLLVDRTCRWQGKDRFLTKYTGNPRFRFTKAALPEATIVCIERDPRAVVMSAVRLHWGFKHKPEKWAALTPIERIDLAVDRCIDYYEKLDGYEEGVDYHLVRYEDLVANPKGELGRLLGLIGLTVDARFERRLGWYSIDPEANDGWKAKTSKDEIDHLNARLGPLLVKRGYEPATT